jgi:hypothetical protein
MSRIRIIVGMANRGIALGMFTGVSVGSIFGLNYSLAGILPGLLVGGFFGIWVGLTVGLVAGILTSVFFFPLTKPDRYRFALTFVCAPLAAGLGTYIVGPFYLIPGGLASILSLVAAVLTIFLSVMFSLRLASWYMSHLDS